MSLEMEGHVHTLRRFSVLALAAASLLAFAGLNTTAQKKGGKIKVKKGYKLEALHQHLKVIRPDNKSWKAFGQGGLGAKLEHGVMVLRLTSFWKAPGPNMKSVVTLNGRQVDVKNTSKLAKEFARKYGEDFKKVFKSTKPKKVKIAEGKAVCFDMIVTGGKSKEGSEMLNRFTADAAGMDATRSFNPREIKMHIRQFVVMGKPGTYVFDMAATEGFFKKHGKDVKKLVKTIRCE